MIHSVEFKEDWRCFKAGDSFDLHHGVNLLVGDQGCGKSSLFQVLRAAASKEKQKEAVVQCDKGTVYSFDLERGNPRMLGHWTDNTLHQVAAMFSSHGEVNRGILNAMNQMSDVVLLIDEPDTALSIRSCRLLVQQLKDLVKRGSQVIAAMHNIAIIQAFDEVLSLEHRKWMKSTDFITSHLACGYCDCYPCGCGG